ncbi:MAG: cation:proton antiporter subunit C [Halanaerobiales bacterium]|nr:cation:proton antiporter subunit C [Halanaerobiales bacterium]
MQIFEKLITNFHYMTAFILFLIGFYTMLTRSNLIKKLIGMNIMDTGVFLFLVSIGYVHDGHAPILPIDEVKELLYVNPLPSALVLTGIVVSLSVSAFAFTLIMKMYKHYGSLDSQDILWAEVDE